MEPVVVIVKDMKNGKILLTEDELKTIVSVHDQSCDQCMVAA